MQEMLDDYPLKIEERLTSTLMTTKPSMLNAFIAASLSVLIISLVSLFYWNAQSAWADLLPASGNLMFNQHQLWRSVSAIFIHADLEHLLSNMYMLWIFTFFIYGYFGLSIFPFVSLGVAALTNIFAVASYEPQMNLLGASGLVYVLGGFWLTMYFLIQRQYLWMNRLVRVLGIAAIIFMPTTFVPSTSYRTHAIGFFLGIIMAVFYFLRNKEKIRSYEVYQVSLV
jgi:rhomboid protease GluP